MINKIPEKFEIICDSCKRLCDNKLDGVLRRQSGVLFIKMSALDWYGSPVANGDVSFDLCDECLNRLIIVINNELESIRRPNDP